MPKTRVQKEELKAKLSSRLSSSQSVVLVGVTGVKVGQIEALRDAFHPLGLHFQVAKNTLLAQVLEEQGITVDQQILDQPLALVFGYEDAVAGPKALEPFRKDKDFEALKVLGGILGKDTISAAQVQALANLPSREQLLGQLLGVLTGPQRGLVTVLSGNIRGLVTALSAIRDQKTA
jgi:large subunit ribosomal protein L10